MPLAQLESIPPDRNVFVCGSATRRRDTIARAVLDARKEGLSVSCLDLGGVANDLRSSAIWHSLRHDPDVMMLDGIDDTEHDALAISTVLAVGLERVVIGLTADADSFLSRADLAIVRDAVAGYYTAG